MKQISAKSINSDEESIFRLLIDPSFQGDIENIAVRTRHREKDYNVMIDRRNFLDQLVENNIVAFGNI